MPLPLFGASDWDERNARAQSFCAKHFPDAPAAKWGTIDYGHQLYGEVGGRSFMVKTTKGGIGLCEESVVDAIKSAIAWPSPC